ncbi:hypothetical protein A3F03_03325 [Candidatus Roizmanbacteria bacterium RIFCSPHIGHO2_12_FULL_41_11]|uniref:Iron hydrogenase large subunit C-terminal domain-containing protein n=3 Tax=Candidatus Roizmaniibacteriota TaxID=1752723 RepID=A0A1F7JQU3_9BACT|nr:MAG: hypothetical protein A3F03_03325 [Candidatus Roizmanbacteria bacterium RIFCSPHIGHO2_12_FULL_41_11]OGK51463.1 MAG: hypothetical protein A2966_00105 [Candidatus Roizmanbacteria bacterium RIFCSPLOWO2_01_FULL_41_22]OGK57976.1 MAG: hypothetical protein A3H86_00040 [Candidatus Roizmanbacteria bacterium RIFCSPLOWO2_02_FULL_41_9]
MAELPELIQLLTDKSKLTAMLAPSFPVVYDYPGIVGKLKRLGFAYVVEVAAGAEETNKKVIEALKKDEKARYITSPCPSFVRMVRKKYPHLEKYLAYAAESPMIQTAKMVKVKWPDYQAVFIGPCFVKKLEASEDFPDLKLLVLTYKELDEVFKHFQINDEEKDKQAEFDITFPGTRLYPISGGLVQSGNLKEILSDDQIQVVSGWQNCGKALIDFQASDTVRLLDILFCDGGCIMGGGITSSLNLEERRRRVTQYWVLGKTINKPSC